MGDGSRRAPNCGQALARARAGPATSCPPGVAEGVEEGRAQRPSRPAEGMIRAAGGVVVKGRGDHAEILLVHRPRYDDWSLPKGKALPGESDEACAIREVKEETGLACELVAELPSTTYRDASGRPKRVR